MIQQGREEAILKERRERITQETDRVTRRALGVGDCQAKLIASWPAASPAKRPGILPFFMTCFMRASAARRVLGLSWNDLGRSGLSARGGD